MVSEQPGGAISKDGGWDISTGSGPPRKVSPLPDRALEAAQGAEWRSLGERPRFGLAGPFPAGWYELHGTLEGLEGIRPRPLLEPRYAGEAEPEPAVRLPMPGPAGELRSLVLLKYDAASLGFAPGVGRARFRMHGFSLHRVSRLRALWAMLRCEPGEPFAAAAVRCLRFAARLARHGKSAATADALARYSQRTTPAAPGDYQSWVELHDTLTSESLAQLAERGARAEADGPLISILLPVYQTPETWLRRCIDSVRAQAYGRWQLCAVDDASPDPRVLEVLLEHAREDARIQVVRRDANGHIAEASNTALGMASGDFVALLDHDDELRPHALLEVAEALRADPGIALLYSDEDKIDVDGRRFDPYFKPDWDPDLLRGQNYLCHLTVLRTGLVRAVGGFRRGFEGSQDHDLVLRCSERLQAHQVHHVPRILYHWRAIPGSTALTRDAKDYAAEAGLQAVAGQMERLTGRPAARGLSHGHYRVDWPLPEPAPRASLVIPTRDRVDLLRTCVESLLEKTDYPDFELVVVDNQSSDPAALEYLESLPARGRVRVLRYDRPFNYSAINNWAVRQCASPLVGLLNNDVEVISPGWLREMASHALRADIGAVGAKLYYPDGSIQHAGVVLGIHGVAGHVYAGAPANHPGHGGRLRVAQRMSAVTGACMVMRRAVFEEAGGLDETLAVAFNDIDLCLRLGQLGYANVWTPFAELYHHESATRGSDSRDEHRERFVGEVELMRRRWGALLECDPAYNPNLSLDSNHFALASPPRHGSCARARLTRPLGGEPR